MYCAMSCAAEMEMGSVDPTDVSAVELLGTKSRNEVA